MLRPGLAVIVSRSSIRTGVWSGKSRAGCGISDRRRECSPIVKIACIVGDGRIRAFSKRWIMIASPVRFIADGKAVEQRPVMLPDVLDGFGVSRGVAVKQLQRVYHLHTGGLCKSKQVVYIRMIENRGMLPFQRASPHTQVANIKIPKQGDELCIRCGEEIPQYTVPVSSLTSRFKTESTEIIRNRKAVRT